MWKSPFPGNLCASVVFFCCRNGTFDQFILIPKDWKGVGQAIIGFSNMSHGGKRGCMTIERPFAYSGIAQSVLDIVEHGRHYSFTAYVRLVDTAPEDSHAVRWVLKYNAGDSKGDLRYIISHAESVSIHVNSLGLMVSPFLPHELTLLPDRQIKFSIFPIIS